MMINEDILIRFLEQSCSPQELKEVDEWIQASPENRDQLFELERVWSLKNEWHYAQPAQIDKAYRTFTKKHFKKQATYWPAFLKYAAVLILGVFVGVGAYVTLHEQEITAAMNFAIDNRQVHLDGEAYFEVSRNESKPFIVQTNNLDVKVLGTKFNISSYDQEETRVTLKEGKVQVDCNAGKESYILHPNEQIIYSEEKGVELMQVDANRISSWTTGDLSFVNEPLEYIVKILERRFDVQIEIDSRSLAEKTFTCTVKHVSTVDQVLDLLQKTQNLTYQKNKEQNYIIHPIN